MSKIDFSKLTDEDVQLLFDGLGAAASEASTETRGRQFSDLARKLQPEPAFNMTVLTERQRDTMLGALRYWQSQEMYLTGLAKHSSDELAEIVGPNPLDAQEIDQLCEQINGSDGLPVGIEPELALKAASRWLLTVTKAHSQAVTPLQIQAWLSPDPNEAWPVDTPGTQPETGPQKYAAYLLASELDMIASALKSQFAHSSLGLQARIGAARKCPVKPDDGKVEIRVTPRDAATIWEAARGYRENTMTPHSVERALMTLVEYLPPDPTKREILEQVVQKR